MRVFVFGAGVSFPAGFPLSKKMLADFRGYVFGRAETDPFCDAIREQWQGLETRGVFDDQVDIEASLTRLEIEARRETDLGLFREYFGDLFTDYFNDSHKQLEEASLDYFRAFVNRNVRPGDVILTFNYDCLAERVLREAGLWNVADGYGYRRELVQDGRVLIDGDSSRRVLKLHGSLGWVSSVVDACFFIQNEALGFVGYPACQDAGFRKVASKRTFVLPSYIKQLDTHPLPTIWRSAADALRRASEVVFIGYSMPFADSAAWMLFLTNLHDSQDILYCWCPDSALRQAEFICRTFELSGIHIRDRKSSVQEFC